METPYRATPDTYVIPSYEMAPGLGLLPCNGYLIQAREPVLVDTGMARESGEFVNAVRSVIDPEQIRWIFITHEEGDHAGALREMLDAAPNARAVMNFVAMAKLGAQFQLPMDRVRLLNPGQGFDAGDRRLTACRPPVYDSPATLALHDNRTGALFTADAFGAFVPEPCQDAADVQKPAFDQGFAIFNRANHPWMTMVDREKFLEGIRLVRSIGPRFIFSAHLPPARGRTDDLLDALSALPDLPPLDLPDQQALELMLAQLQAGGG